MKKILLTVITLTAFFLGATAQIVNIPDANFKAYLVGNSAINTNSDSEIQMSEAETFTGVINCSNLNISDLTGVEAFTTLTELTFQHNNVSSVDLSQNIALTRLYCGNNLLNSLDVSNNTALEFLYTNDNNLSTLEVSNNTTLYRLVCVNNNLTSLDLSQNTSLELLSCGDNDLGSLNLKNLSPNTLSTFIATSNPNLTCIEVDDITTATTAWTNIDPQSSFNTTCSQIVNIPDANFKACLVSNTSINTNGDAEIQVSEANVFSGIIECQGQGISDLTGIEAFTAITELHVYANNLTTIDVSQNTALTSLQCGGNSNLTSLNVSQNAALTNLNTFNCTSLSTLDVSQNTALEILIIGRNNLSTLDLSQNIALKLLQCQENSLNTLDLSQNTVLENFHCPNNSINALDLSQNPALTLLNASYNNLSTLDLSQNIALTEVKVGINTLTSLNLSQNTALAELNVYSNNLTSLDLSQNTALKVFNCQANQMNTLDLNENLALEELYCNSNDLTVLNLKNISISQLTEFEAGSNPNLTCIEVDDATAAAANWAGSIDPQTSFSEDCAYIIPVTSINVQGQGGATTISTLGGTLQMEATILPMNATDPTYTWSVINLSGSADIDANGVLTALTDGVVKVGVTANDGSGVTGSADITISNQSSNTIAQDVFQNLTIYPNPVSDQVIVESEAVIETISIIDLMGKTVRTLKKPNSKIDVSDLSQGVYFLEIKIEDALISKKIIKE